MGTGSIHGPPSSWQEDTLAIFWSDISKSVALTVDNTAVPIENCNSFSLGGKASTAPGGHDTFAHI